MVSVPSDNASAGGGSGGTAITSSYIELVGGQLRPDDPTWDNYATPWRVSQGDPVTLDDTQTFVLANLAIYGTPDVSPGNSDLQASLSLTTSVAVSDASAAVPGEQITMQLSLGWLLGWAQALVPGDYDDWDSYGSGKLYSGALDAPFYEYTSSLLVGGCYAPADAGGWENPGVGHTLSGDEHLTLDWSGWIKFQID